MGSLLTRFRKQPTTLEQLKTIEESLRKIEEYKRNTERQQKRTVASVIIYGAALYILGCVIVFVWYLPESWIVRLGLLIPLIMVPVIIYYMKRVISRYFQSKMVRFNEDYADLQRKKVDIIDSVMETETFNKAKEILSKYAPEKLEKKLQECVDVPPPVPVKPSTDLRKRNNIAGSSSTTNQRPQLPPRALPPPINTQQLVRFPGRIVNSSVRPPLPMPQPVFPKNRSIAEKLVEYIIGDGPSYRYALICKFCNGHNGMALKEEFPYMAYTCCFCLSFNPARSKRLLAPRLPDAEEDKFPALPSTEALLVQAIQDKLKTEDSKDKNLPGPSHLENLVLHTEGGDSDANSKSTLEDGISDSKTSEIQEQEENILDSLEPRGFELSENKDLAHVQNGDENNASTNTNKDEADDISFEDQQENKQIEQENKAEESTK